MPVTPKQTKKATAKKAVRKKPPAKAKKKVVRKMKPYKHYDASMPQKLIDFYDVEPYEDTIVHKKSKNVEWDEEVRRPNKLPTLRDFAKHIGVGRQTLYQWMDKKDKKYHPELEAAYKVAKEHLKEFLIQNALLGLYNPVSFKFVAVNMTDMRDKKEEDVNIGGQKDNPLPTINITLTKARDAK